MCKVLEISKSGYYSWIQRTPSERDKRREQLSKAAIISHRKSYGIYGYRKVYNDIVQEHKIECCKETVRRIMRDNGLCSRTRKKFVRTTDSNHKYKVAENILDGCFEVNKPNTVWVADITYIRTALGWHYLAIVMDLYARMIVGWAMSQNIDAELVRNALRMALAHRCGIKKLMHHSDQGSQYCSDMYQNELNAHHITCSMSRKGNCWDNACAESFFGSLKSEWIQDKVYDSRKEAEKDIFFYIEMFYNRQRRHESLGYVTPVEFETRFEEEHAA
jgi:transposase InsO family protein